LFCVQSKPSFLERKKFGREILFFGGRTAVFVDTAPPLHSFATLSSANVSSVVSASTRNSEGEKIGGEGNPSVIKIELSDL
jgi:hypothetical protein